MLKKITTIILSVLCLLSLLCFSACSSSKKEGAEPENDIDVTITLKDTEVFIKNGNTYKLSYSAQNAETFTPIWASTNEDVCTVNNGNILAVGDGEADVSLTINKTTQKCKVTVFTYYQKETANMLDGEFEVYKLCNDRVPKGNDITISLSTYGLSYDKNASAKVIKGDMSIDLSVRSSSDKKKYYIGLEEFGSSIYGEGISIELASANKMVTIPLEFVVTKFIRCAEDLNNLFFYGGMLFDYAPFSNFVSATKNIINISIINYDFDMTEEEFDAKFDNVVDNFETNSYYVNASADVKTSIMQQLPESKNLVKSIYFDETKKAEYIRYLLYQYDGYFIQSNSIDLESIPLDYRTSTTSNNNVCTFVDEQVFIDRDNPDYVGRHIISESGPLYSLFNVDTGFLGVYDGKGNTIDNMSLQIINTSNINGFMGNRGGIFGGISTKAVVKNLGVTANDCWTHLPYNRMFVLAGNVNGTLEDIYVKVTFMPTKYYNRDNQTKGAYALGFALSGASLTDVVVEYEIDENLFENYEDVTLSAYGYKGIDIAYLPNYRVRKESNTFENCYFFYTKVGNNTASTEMSGFTCYDLSNVPDMEFELTNPEYWGQDKGYPVFLGC